MQNRRVSSGGLEVLPSCVDDNNPKTLGTHPSGGLRAWLSLLKAQPMDRLDFEKSNINNYGGVGAGAKIQEMCSTLGLAGAQKAIEEFDPLPNEDDPQTPEIINALTTCHRLLGNHQRAVAFNELGMKLYKKLKDNRAYAKAISHRAALTWNEERYDQAFKELDEALTIDPLCEMAWCNRLGYASKLHDCTRLADGVAAFVATVPDWWENPVYVTAFTTDAHFTWAKRDKTFIGTITNKLEEIRKETK